MEREVYRHEITGSIPTQPTCLALYWLGLCTRINVTGQDKSHGLTAQRIGLGVATYVGLTVCQR